MVTIFFGNSPVNSSNFFQPFNSILASPSRSPLRNKASLTGLGSNKGSNWESFIGNLSPLLLSGMNFKLVDFFGFICLLNSSSSRFVKNLDNIPHPAFEAPPQIH